MYSAAPADLATVRFIMFTPPLSEHFVEPNIFVQVTRLIFFIYSRSFLVSGIMFTS